MSDSADARPRLRVLHTLQPPDGTTKFVDHMVGSAPDDVEILFWSWETALAGDYDVLHIHWPELLIRRRRRLSAAVRRHSLRRLLRRTARRHVPIVRTLHNVDPHEAASPAEARALESVDRATTVAIRLNPTTPVREGWIVVDVPHGHYRDAFAAHEKSRAVSGRLTYVGLIRPYKNVGRLIETFRAVDDPALSLTIAGKPTAGLGAQLREAAAGDDRIALDLAFVPDPALVRHVTEAELVVLPYSEMHNSGILLVTLSLDRPALVPDSPSNAALAAEVGEEWIIRYRGDLTPQVLQGAMESARARAPGARPDLSSRGWDHVGADTVRAYDAARAAVRRGST